MTAYCPNFYDTFLERYCRDKLACTIPCKKLANPPGSNVKAVYPHINKALAHVYHNQKVHNFNNAYHNLACYLEEYPKVVNKINAVLWSWLYRKAPRKPNFNCERVEYCKCKDYEHVDCDPDSHLPINIINGVTNPGIHENSWCNRCERPKYKNGRPYVPEKPCGPCGYDDDHDAKDPCNPCDEYKRVYHKEKKCHGGCTYRKPKCYCGEEELVCEPRGAPKAEICVPKPDPTCHHIPCSRSLKRDLTDTVPHCLKYDEKLQYLVADVVRYCL